MLERLCLEDFLPLVGSEIDVEANGQNARLQLKQAATIKSPSPRATPPFHLILRSGSSWRAAQGIFRLHHPDLGALELFAVPIGPDGEGFCYEIIFN